MFFASFEIHFYTMFPADVLAALTQSFHVGYSYIRLLKSLIRLLSLSVYMLNKTGNAETK